MNIAWHDGMTLSSEHLLFWDECTHGILRQLCGFALSVGLWDAELDATSWEQGFVRWSRLRLLHANGEVLEESGALQPGVLAVPEAVQGMGANELSIWVWPTEQWQFGEVVRGMQKIATRRREWRQSLEEPGADCVAVCVQRYVRQGRHWTLDSTFLPPLLRAGASAHGFALLARLEQWCQQALQNQALPPSTHTSVQSFAALLPILADRPLEVLQVEWIRLLGTLGVPMSRLPTAGWVNVLWGMLAQLPVQRERVKSLMRLEVPRANAALFSVALRSEDWESRAVELVWTRTLAFTGDEHKILRLASLGQMPRLVRAALPGVALASIGAPVRQGAQFQWRLRIEVGDALWSEILTTRSLAIHCPGAGDLDSFVLEESAHAH